MTVGEGIARAAFWLGLWGTWIVYLIVDNCP